MPHKLIRKGFFSELHFDPDNDFIYKEKDKVSGREIVRTIKFEQRPTVGKDLTKLPEAEAKKALQLADLLEKALMLDPSKRLTPSQALTPSATWAASEPADSRCFEPPPHPG